ncbi:hypothetical protein [Marinagarivorans algicola]|uniref:hypothetical protein n=1 Tax=Marinagarivorans algicola TaxID=1513270 RepID=UPI0006B5360B|nr:hypothetical protein [Marinagarivorans algicola]
MNKPSPLVYLALVAYIFAPALIGWVMDPKGHWYRPFGIWLLVVVVAYLVQKYRAKRAAEQKAS